MRPDLKPSTADSRSFCVRSACSAAVRMPREASADDSLSAPRLVRTKTRIGPGRGAAQELGQPVGLLAGRDVLDGVADGAGGGVAAADLDQRRVGHDGAREAEDLVRHRGREEQRLALGRQRVDDAPDVGPEAHVEHAVGFVEDQRLEAVELGARPHVVHQPARRGDDERDARGQGPRLRLHRGAAVDGHAADAGVIAEALHVVVDLDGQLAGRRQHQHPRAGRLGWRAGGVGGGRRGQQPIDQRQHEGGRLAGAGFGAGDDVAAGADQRQHRRLDRRGVGEAAVADAGDQLLVEAERLEGERLGVGDGELAGRFDRRRGNRRGSGRFRGAGRAGTAAGRTATGLGGGCSQADVVLAGIGAVIAEVP